jgi:GTP-binding protein
VIVVVNKWDLVAGAARPPSAARTPGGRIRPGEDEPASPHDYEQRLRDKLKFLAYAPVLFISAVSGKNTEKVFQTVELVAAERRKRIPTAEINRFLATVDFERASVPSAKKVRIYYMTQAATSPPTFVLFTDRAVKLHFSYQRFLENQIRRAFGFVGTPIWIKNRARK